MNVAGCLARSGGIASRQLLIRLAGRAAVDRALATGTIVAVGRGRYADPAVERAVALAHAMSGTLSHLSAALWHGWEVKTVPDRPHVTVPRGRKVSAERRRLVHLHRADLTCDDRDGIATGRELTLSQCLRSLPFDEALAVADSALRHGELATLRRVAAAARGPGAPRIRRVAAAARPEAANPFESTLRALGLEAGLLLRPQLRISCGRTVVRPDLVDAKRRIVLEADSFTWHGDRHALRRDARRYNLLVVDGWLVLRFSWEDVMFDPEYVLGVLRDVRALVDGRTEVATKAARPASSTGENRR